MRLVQRSFDALSSLLRGRKSGGVSARARLSEKNVSSSARDAPACKTFRADVNFLVSALFEVSVVDVANGSLCPRY